MRHRIRVDEIPAAGLAYQADEKVPVIREKLVDALDTGGDHRCRAELHVERKDRRVHIAGRVEMSLALHCARCTNEFAFAAEREMQVVLLLDASDEEEKELQDAEMDESFLEGETIDLPELVREQVLLTVPDKPLCRPECKGLCPHCGADLNEVACGCRDETVDPRLAVLGSLELDEDN